MKNLLFSLRHALCIALFSVLGSQLYSQGNLQFNQVITETISLAGGGNNGTYNSANTYTVPLGKVWKLGSASYMTYSANNTYGPRVFIQVNGVQVLSNPGGTSVYDRAGNLNSQPIWFKPGDVISFGMINNCATNCSQSANLLFSVVEFNIIP